MKRLLLLVLVLVLAACAEVPAGNYYLVPAGTITPDYMHCEGTQCWRVQLLKDPTSEVGITPSPTSVIQKCEIRAGSGIPYYAQPSTAGGALGLLGEGITYQPLTVLATNNNIWAYIPGKGYVPDMAGFRIFDNEACRDLLQPVNTPVPTSAVPTPTPIQKIYACPVGASYLNIRTGPGTNYQIVGQLQPGQKLQIVTKLQSGWWEVIYGSLPGQYIAGWLAKEC